MAVKSDLSSLYQALSLDSPPPLLIGERANTTGSKKFRECLLADDDEGCLSILKAQERGGAHILDLSVAYAGRNEKEDMVRILKKATLQLTAPLMIDSTQEEVIEAALKHYPGRPIVNSINLERGEEPLKRICHLVHRYGAAVVALVIDEEGMALTAQRKLEVAQRIYNQAIACGLREEDLFFDALTFTLASGDSNYAESALETLEGIRLIKNRFPKARTLLGVSNVSFGLPPVARKVLNSVFLAEAVKIGLDGAIIDPAKVIPFNKIDPKEKEGALALIENRSPHALQEFINLFSQKEMKKEIQVEKNFTHEQRLKQAIFDGDKTAVEEVIPLLVKNYSGEEILNEFLIGAMKEVGDLFGKGEMLLPFVLQSAEALRRGVDLLKPYLGKGGEREEKKVKVLLATVAGDVHDIGKNLVGMILENNGFTVYDIGVKADVSFIIEKAKEYDVDIIGLSGLLVKSALIMKENLQIFEKSHLKQPILLGGAALSRSFVVDECAPLYSSAVIYCHDAFASLSCAMEWREKGFLQRILSPQIKKENPHSPIKPSSSAHVRPFSNHPLISVPFEGSRLIESITWNEIEKTFPQRALFQSRWKLIGEEKRGQEVLQRLLHRYGSELEAKAVYGYFPCAAKETSLEVEGGAGFLWKFPVLGRNQEFALSDFFNLKEEGGDWLPLAVVTMGKKWSSILTELRERGELTESFFLYGFLAELTEAALEVVHRRILEEVGRSQQPSIRFSFGYPACPELSYQKELFTLLKPQRIGVNLTDSYMMEPEFSVSAIMPLSPHTRYF